MNSRAYYTDSYTIQFDAAIVEAIEVDSRPAVRLDRTYFYPTSGGQPNDSGWLRQGERAVRVEDVLVSGADEAIFHVLDASLAAGLVTAAIDWPRRFDHMQHHTGQHILSQAFVRVAEAETVSFHLSPQSVTIDVDRPDLTTEEVRAAEQLANEVVWQNRPVTAREVARDEAATLPLRKLPPGRDGRLRLIEIADFDLTACGGTHVSGTAEVGLIKVLKTERRAGSTRVEFCCGTRAFADYRAKHSTIQRLSAALTTGVAELPASVDRLQDEAKALRAELKRQQTALLRLEADNLLREAEPVGAARLVCRVLSGREAGEARQLATRLVQEGDIVALLGISGEQAQLIFARSADGPAFAHMGELIKPALAALGGARGGGGATSAQGGGLRADEATVTTALSAAAARLREAANLVE